MDGNMPMPVLTVLDVR